MLIPHSTNVTSEQVLALLESLIPTLGLDPAQEIGVRAAIEELHDLTEGPTLEEQLDDARHAERAECEDEHADALKALKQEHAEELAGAREESREDDYALGVTDAESVIERLLTRRGFGELLDDENDDFTTMVENEREAREHREAVAERERLERAEQAVRKRGASRKPRKKAGSQ